jgi:DNA-binding NtrC family response regulator
MAEVEVDPEERQVDTGILEKRFRELSLQLHPDRFAHADARERRMSLEQSSALNQAYRTLRDPERRAFSLLQQEGVDLERLVSEYEREWVTKALDHAGGVRKRAAMLLGISFRSLRYRLAKLGIDKDDDDAEA